MLNLILNGRRHEWQWKDPRPALAETGWSIWKCMTMGPVSPDMREKVFELLYTSKPDGTGLGLVSVRTAVTDELRGEISVIDSPFFGGACFRISLPR
jgi:hypothetical protein